MVSSESEPDETMETQTIGEKEPENQESSHFIPIFKKPENVGVIIKKSGFNEGVSASCTDQSPGTAPEFAQILSNLIELKELTKQLRNDNVSLMADNKQLMGENKTLNGESEMCPANPGSAS